LVFHQVRIRLNALICWSLMVILTTPVH
jgi:hypothetical protein